MLAIGRPDTLSEAIIVPMSFKRHAGAHTPSGQGQNGRRLMAAGLSASIGLNIALAGYLYLFVPNSPFRPICSRQLGGGTAELKGTMSFDFEQYLSPGISEYGIRVGPIGGALYVARWERWFDDELLWNNTTKATRWFYEDRGVKLEDVTCKEVRAAAFSRTE